MVKPQFTAGSDLMLDIYARVSRVGDERQRSTGGQVDDCTVRVQDLGATVGRVHVDDGRSAWNPIVRRPKWDSLMTRLESGETGGVVVFDIARFSRRPIEGERLILAVERGLVVLDSEGEYDLETANGRKAFRDQLNAAAYESDRLSSRVKRGKRVKVAWASSSAAMIDTCDLDSFVTPNDSTSFPIRRVDTPSR
ncbi:recombinase family protein [Nocardia amikacinitolerans]|uniref:recombinase family protein n=1 Tax=Nocardia amikacinitolerans TaxID=756689 RepID=UPI00117F0E88